MGRTEVKAKQQGKCMAHLKKKNNNNNDNKIHVETVIHFCTSQNLMLLEIENAHVKNYNIE